jgi:hypothetical protein
MSLLLASGTGSGGGSIKGRGIRVSGVGRAGMVGIGLGDRDG